MIRSDHPLQNLGFLLNEDFWLGGKVIVDYISKSRDIDTSSSYICHDKDISHAGCEVLDLHLPRSLIKGAIGM